MLHSICQQIWKTQQWPQDWKRAVFIPVPKKGNAKECSNNHTIALSPHASKIMLKILQVRLQQYMNWDSRCISWVSKRQRNHRLNWHYLLDRVESKIIPENVYIFFLTMLKSVTVQIKKKKKTLWKILKEMGIPAHLTCLLRNLSAGQEATVRTGHEIVWFQIGKRVWQGCILSSNI